MQITLSPQRADTPLSLATSGAALILNGVNVDLATYDASVAPSDWIVGQPVQVEEDWHVTLVLPHGGSAPDETRYPAPITVTEDGPVKLPVYDREPDDSTETILL